MIGSPNTLEDPRPPLGFVPAETPLRFDLDVADGGYAWWYVDAVSSDGSLALTLIAFVGSVFSPRYAKARRAMAAGGPAAQAEQHCAINLAVYRRGGRNAWALTEHASVERTPQRLTIGRSQIAWGHDARGDHLAIEIDEHETKFGGRSGTPLRGHIRLYPSARFGPRIALDRGRSSPRHRWYPVAPHAQVEVEFEAPSLAFSGSGYHDVNEGDEGLELGFDRWNWSRAELAGGRTAILYDVVPRQGELDPRGWLFVPERRTIELIEPDALGPAVALPQTRWRVARSIRTELGHPPRLISTLEDTPFYSRNLVATRIVGADAIAMHESIDLDRFAARPIQFLLGFKTNARASRA